MKNLGSAVLPIGIKSTVMDWCLMFEEIVIIIVIIVIIVIVIVIVNVIRKLLYLKEGKFQTIK